MDKPVLFEDGQDYWTAWNELHRARIVGWVPCPITTTDIKSWLDIHGVDDLDLCIDFYDLINVMDDTWLAWARSEHTKNTVNPDADTPSSD